VALRAILSVKEGVVGIYELIAQAIKNKQHVIATYRGYRREMCPHTLGRSRAGRRQALFYQFGGESSSGLAPDGWPDNWRCIPIDELEKLEVRDGEWHTSPFHTQLQTCVFAVEVEVSY
jgi:hypothetical protein